MSYCLYNICQSIVTAMVDIKLFCWSHICLHNDVSIIFPQLYVILLVCSNMYACMYICMHAMYACVFSSRPLNNAAFELAAQG